MGLFGNQNNNTEEDKQKGKGKVKWKDKYREIRLPATPIESSFSPSEDCCLIQQSFSIGLDLELEEEHEIEVYHSPGYQPSCTPDGKVAKGKQAHAFGTVRASNTGYTPFVLQVSKNGEGPAFTQTLYPGTQVVYSGSIASVVVLSPGESIRSLFDFNINLLPFEPV